MRVSNRAPQTFITAITFNAHGLKAKKRVGVSLRLIPSLRYGSSTGRFRQDELHKTESKELWPTIG